MPIAHKVITKSLEGKPKSKSCTTSIVFLATETYKSQMIIKIRLCKTVRQKQNINLRQNQETPGSRIQDPAVVTPSRR